MKTNNIANIVLDVDATQSGWSKRGKCLRGSGNCAIAIVEDVFNGEEGKRPIGLSLLGTMQLKISNKNNVVNEDGNFLEFAEMTLIPQNIATILGKSSITILPGTYVTDFSTNPFGTTIVDIIVLE